MLMDDWCFIPREALWFIYSLPHLQLSSHRRGGKIGRKCSLFHSIYSQIFYVLMWFWNTREALLDKQASKIGHVVWYVIVVTYTNRNKQCGDSIHREGKRTVWAASETLFWAWATSKACQCMDWCYPTSMLKWTWETISIFTEALFKMLNSKCYYFMN